MTLSAIPSPPLSTRQWLFDFVCPYWQNHVLSSEGGFYESLCGTDAGDVPNTAPLRGVLNQARLTYVFSHAALLSGDAKFRQAAEHGFAYLLRCYALRTPFEGWHRSTHVDGSIVDATRDTYDQSFVIFAMTYYHRLTGSTQALEIAEQTYQFLESEVADHAQGGFHEVWPFSAELPRRQNPHMHLLEAALAMHKLTGEAHWLARAASLVDLFKRVFFDASSTSLVEYFDQSWHIAKGDFGDLNNLGALREPGHQFEWVWLLHNYAQQSGDTTLDPYIDALFAFGTAHGLDRDGPLKNLVIEFVGPDGEWISDAKLMWPQTEYIKACVTQFERTGDPSFRAEAAAHLARTQAHLMRKDSANWLNKASRDGADLWPDTPSRVLYHVFLAAVELLRVEGK